MNASVISEPEDIIGRITKELPEGISSPEEFMEILLEEFLAFFNQEIFLKYSSEEFQKNFRLLF